MNLEIACLQTSGQPGDVQANIRELSQTAEIAAARGADLLITPELFVTGYDIGDQIRELATPHLADLVSAVAADHGIAMIAGLPETAPGEGIYNSAYFFDSSGTVRGIHRKTHLFGDLDRKYFQAGTEAVSLVDYKGVTIAMMICYDAEFPENVRMAALCGADLVAVPTAQMEPFAFVAEYVMRTRAWENQIYLAYVNHDGAERSTVYVGNSSIISPNGDVVAKMESGTGLVYGTIDTEIVHAAQRANPYLSDLRPSLNQLLVTPRSDFSHVEL